jgi:hypothetical protein
MLPLLHLYPLERDLHLHDFPKFCGFENLDIDGIILTFAAYRSRSVSARNSHNVFTGIRKSLSTRNSEVGAMTTNPNCKDLSRSNPTFSTYTLTQTWECDAG